MIGEYILYMDGRSLGALRVSVRGLLTVFEAECGGVWDGIYKAAASDGERDLPLGVMCPENGILRARRSFSRMELERAGIGAVTHGRMYMIHMFPNETAEKKEPAYGWYAEYQPERHFGDELLKYSSAGIGGALARNDGGDMLLALPFETDGPFPLTTLFCFAVLQRIGGKTYAVFRTDGGVPVIENEARPFLKKP